MEEVSVLHMSSGDGESSYANNSSFQEIVIRKSLQVLVDTIEATANHDIFFNECFKIADLGCSSGKNTLSVTFAIVDMIHKTYSKYNRRTPQFQVYLNDLFGNDFNNIFKLLPNFYANLKKERGEDFGPCFVSAVPGSFYDRLFPDKSLHLVYSSYSIHWLSQVPEGLENNKSNIYMAKASPSNVFQAYQNQYYTDFTKFLQLRSKEIVCGGRMVLTFNGRRRADPTSDDCCSAWELIAIVLVDMVKEGLIPQTKLNSFNIPFYSPCEEEVRNVIQNEGSFNLDKLSDFQVNWDPHDTDYTSLKDSIELSDAHGESFAKAKRAVVEPMLASHFGSSIIEMVFKKYAKYVSEHLVKSKTRTFNIVISLTKK
ncbi:S-adenosyl-L-methionine:benzoic acid/salicylic acid carboxyl methyltransferase 3-like [Rutidosis leptorrhynchoides]|uniref:S-adenosyl-L-methionine:benzoic acid/salicylic acid carboxyl methyltransferase 3-like n=1 Tax=Rutidosis leptorrhynchoides TaxID=125765 RepID=UPI003A9962B4